MAQLPNIIEKERSFLKVIYFVLVSSIRGSKKYSILWYSTVILNSFFLFVEFGALGMVINEFIAYGINGAHMPVIFKAFSLIIISNFFPPVLGSLRSYYYDIQRNDMYRYLQTLEFEKINELDIGTIEQPEFQNILEIVSSRRWNGFFNIMTMVVSSLGNISELIIATVSLSLIFPWALLVIFISVIPTYFFEKNNAKNSAELWTKSSENRRAWDSKLGEIYDKSSLIELKNFNLVKVFLRKWYTLVFEFHQDSQRLGKNSLKNDLLAAVIITLGYGATFFLIIHQVILGKLLVGSLVYTFAIISRFQSSLQQLFDNFGRITEHKKNVDKFIDFFEMKSLIISGTKIILPEDFKTLEICNISFFYPGSEKYVIRNFSLKIKKGDSIAIVGLNGAGKTTFIKLLTRVYDPTEGEILLNGINLKEYDLQAWKKCLAVLFQDYTTYSEETIAENIMLGDTTKHDQEYVERSAHDSTAHEYIKQLTEKYDQKVGTEFRGGVELSKGQKQKLALARVFYRNAPIMILDEPTAAIDALSEDIIFKSLREKHTHQTRIIISHKFSNVRDADRIILIEQGVIIEQGSHPELMAIPEGRYRELFELQAEGYK